MTLFLSILLFSLFTLEVSHGQRSDTGDFTTTSNKRLFNCCKRANQICRAPCRGRECSAKCTVKCGFLGKVCDPITCEASNPSECTAGRLIKRAAFASAHRRRFCVSDASQNEATV